LARGLSRRAVLAALPLSASFASLAHAAAPGLTLSGKFVQGGYAVGHTAPRAVIDVDGQVLTTASAGGWFVVGFDRDAPPAEAVVSTWPSTSITARGAVWPTA
jgi:hypothetical protein